MVSSSTKSNRGRTRGTLTLAPDVSESEVDGGGPRGGAEAGTSGRSQSTVERPEWISGRKTHGSQTSVWLGSLV